MWQFTSLFVSLVLCLEFVLLVNVAGDSNAEFTSSVLSRISAWGCAVDADCTIADSSCVGGYCECNGNYIYNSDMTACYPAATAYGDACTETLQCSTYLLSGAVCQDEVCICGDGYHYARGRCHRSIGLGEACTADVNCYVNADTEATSCVNGVCVCSDGFYQREYRTCRRIGFAEGDECAINLDCQFENGVCTSSFVCTVSTATSTEVLDNNVYEDNRVVRSLGRVDGNATVGTECVSDDDCTTLANSMCGRAGTCICNRAYYASKDLSTCLPEIGEDCSSDDAVTITNSLCRNGTWSCGYSTVASLSQQLCRKTTKVYDTSCTSDEQCYIFGPDASCTNKRCLCNEGSHHVKDLLFCWISKGIGESCQANEDCYVQGLDTELTCTNSVCTCPNGTSPNADNTLCRIDNAVLGDICEVDDDCLTANSACINSVCGCAENYLKIDDYCAAGINATCSSDNVCVVASATCTENNVCSCAEGFVAEATDSCLPVATYGEKCESDVQCSTALSNSYCSSVPTNSNDEESNSTAKSSCDCESDYHYRFGVCNRKTAIGGACTSRGDCYVETGIEDVVCRKGVCACDWDSSAVGETTCSRLRGNATTFFLSTWLGVLLIGVKIFLI